MLSDIILNVVMLSIVAPFHHGMNYPSKNLWHMPRVSMLWLRQLPCFECYQDIFGFQDGDTIIKLFFSIDAHGK
jgi:hypothetical protein